MRCKKEKCKQCGETIQGQPCIISRKICCKICYFELKSKLNGKNCYDKSYYKKLLAYNI